MTERPVTVPACGDGQALDGHLRSFLETLEAKRYQKQTREGKRRTLERFIRWTQDSRLELSGLDESRIASYQRSVLGDCSRRDESKQRATLRQFLDHLRWAGVVPPSCQPTPSVSDVLVGRYTDYLRHGRGLSPYSVAVYVPFVREFVAAQAAPGQASFSTSLDASVVRSHLLDRARGRSSEYTRLLATALRSFLRFLLIQGEVSVDLSEAIPPVRRWQLAAVPAFLSPDEVKQVLAAIDRTTARGRRDFAMLLLLARLGLRAGEVAKLELDDIHWAAGEVVVPGKGRYHDRLPLPEDVGEALAVYLRYARGSSSSRRVFLRAVAPHVGLTGPYAVCIVARKAVRRAGLCPSGRVGAHVFRHNAESAIMPSPASESP